MGWMDFLKRLKNKLSVTPDEEEQVLREILGIRKDTKRKLMSEVTYFTCLKMLSETMGKLPLKYYQDTKNGRIRASPSEMSYLLTVRPNSIMTPSTLWSTTEMNCQHYGNGYIWIQWQYLAETYGGRVVPRSLWPLQSSQVEVIMDNAGVFGESGKCYYVYNDPRTGEQYIFEEHEIMHFKTWYSLDGFLGEPVRNILKYTIDGAAESQTFMNNLYKQGLTASMVMQYSDNLDEERIKKLKKKFGDQLTGSKNAGKIIPIPSGLTLTPLKMSLTDSQFFELRKYSALQIAGAFGIKPNQLNDYEKSSYSNSEMQQLAFLVDTLAYRLKMYEEEINAKALRKEQYLEGFSYKFNEKAILRQDSGSQMEMLKGAVNNGIYTPNEAREFLDKEKKEGGDVLVMNGNYIPLTMVGAQYGGKE